MTRYYGLYLNPMMGKCEETQIICVAINKEILQKILDENKVDYYRDDNWNKYFKKGSELEWYNPPEHCFGPFGIIDLGTKEEYIKSKESEFDDFISKYIRD